MAWKERTPEQRRQAKRDAALYALTDDNNTYVVTTDQGTELTVKGINSARTVAGKTGTYQRKGTAAVTVTNFKASHLTNPQRAVLNFAVRMTGRRIAVRADAVCTLPGVDYDVLYELVDAEMLTGPHRWALERLFDPGAAGAAKHMKCCIEPYRKAGDKEALIHFHPTQKGRTAVESDALSALVRSLHTAVRVTLAAAVADFGRGPVEQAWQDGFVSAHWAGDDRELTRVGDYEFRQAARDIVVRRTRRAIEIGL